MAGDKATVPMWIRDLLPGTHFVWTDGFEWEKLRPAAENGFANARRIQDGFFNQLADGAAVEVDPEHEAAVREALIASFQSSHGG